MVHFADKTSARLSVLSILDDASRYVLCAMIIRTETTANVVATFRKAAARYGLCHKWYADRGSAYDSYDFRKGLAMLGIHRIRTKAKNAEAHGKIEAYHRVLRRWFVKELKHQLVGDMNHLQDLLNAVIEELYHKHIHRDLKMPPKRPSEILFR